MPWKRAASKRPKPWKRACARGKWQDQVGKRAWELRLAKACGNGCCCHWACGHWVLWPAALGLWLLLPLGLRLLLPLGLWLLPLQLLLQLLQLLLLMQGSLLLLYFFIFFQPLPSASFPGSLGTLHSQWLQSIAPGPPANFWWVVFPQLGQPLSLYVAAWGCAAAWGSFPFLRGLRALRPSTLVTVSPWPFFPVIIPPFVCQPSSSHLWL